MLTWMIASSCAPDCGGSCGSDTIEVAERSCNWGCTCISDFESFSDSVSNLEGLWETVNSQSEFRVEADLGNWRENRSIRRGRFSGFREWLGELKHE